MKVILIIYFLICIGILSQDNTKEEENSKNEKTISELETSIKKNQADLESLKKKLAIQENTNSDKFISPLKTNGLSSEYNRSLFLDTDHSKKFTKNEKAWLNDWIRIGAFIRPRYEDRYNLAFDKQNKGNISRIMQTTQLFVIIDPNPYFSMKITIQDARVWGGSTPAQTGDQRANSFDGVGRIDPAGSSGTSPSGTTIREAWFMIKKLPLDAKIQIGRQIIAYGDQRIIGGANWTINGLSFDGARIMFDYEKFSIHLLGYKIIGNQSGPNGVLSANAPTTTIDSTGRTITVNPGQPNQYLMGTYNSIKFNNWAILDLYSLGFLTSKTRSYSGAIVPSQGINVSSSADSDLYNNPWSKQKDNLFTTGFRLTNRTSGNNLPIDSPYKAFDWTIESAWQTGTTGARVIKNIYQNELLNTIYSTSLGLSSNTNFNLVTENQKYSGQFYVFQTGYTFFEKLRFGVQYLYSSGDSSLNDGSKSTFQTLTNPRFGVIPYWNNVAGFSENINTKNLTSRTINLSYKTNQLGTFYVSYFWNDKTKTQDSWYAVNGLANTNATVEQVQTNQTTHNLARSSRSIYNELDFTWMYGINENVSIWLGAGVLFAGDSVKNQKNAILNYNTKTGAVGINNSVLLGQSGAASTAYMIFVQFNAAF
jgi:Alginate export